MSSESFGSYAWNSPKAGITGGYNGDNLALRSIIIFFTGLAMYNACELVIMILATFKSYHGLYFWSILISSLAVIPHALGFFLKFLVLTSGPPLWVAIAMNTTGWYAMVTGQALVLWSRLHLILHGPRGDKIIEYTKWMIICDAVLLHIPTTVLSFGSNSSTDTHIFVRGYTIMEKVQMCGFFCQEVILSSIYIIETTRILRGSLRPNTRRTMQELFSINALIILLDLVLLGLEAASLYILETTVKGVIYSIKLKLELVVLGKLVKLVKGGLNMIELDDSPEFGKPDVDESINQDEGGGRPGTCFTGPHDLCSKQRQLTPDQTIDVDTVEFSEASR